MIPENQPQQPDDEAVHYRARVDAISTPEATPPRAPMSEARIERLQHFAEKTLSRDSINLSLSFLSHGCLDLIAGNARQRAVIAERDAEMERLTGAMRIAVRLTRNWPEDDPEQNLDRIYTVLTTELNRQTDAKALAGEAVLS